ncbi:MAG: hypothetical protein JKY47_07030 [Thalassospira sp.]|uniref:hypothetical protein n=1 Tax=Thalassospira sp. 11-3 TaxID=2135614 RepID=UPI000D765AB6|nr:hypothetical protein [Thalassospira sp. 11-3]MBL4840571.1 hypothetical protein [Thalassospira sp.]PXX34608.1 hypothetical protein C7967_102670 [Thalassospira sp. 11-3]
MSLFLCLIAGILAFGIPAKADQWLCGPSFGSVNARGSDVRSIPIRLAKPETVDALIATSRPDILWRLADIAFVPEFEDAALSTMQNGSSAITDLVAYDQTPDFAGRHLADMRDGFGQLWQEKLLEAGLVMLLPETGRPIDALLAAEQSAMSQQIGLWAPGQSPAYHYAGSSEIDGDLPDAARAVGRFAVIDGILQRIEDREWRSYLNFGSDWRNDFTVMVDRDLRDAIKTAGQHMEDWIGHKIRVRGMIEDRGGPYLELTNPASLCVEQSVGQP